MRGLNRPSVEQIKGKANGLVPDAYRPAVRGLLDILNPCVINDTWNIGCISFDGGIVDVTAANTPCDADFVDRLFRKHKTIGRWHAYGTSPLDAVISDLELAGAAGHVLKAAKDYRSTCNAEVAKIVDKVSATSQS
jgi:hypothetical protein